jgi:hypothetical protein
MPGDGEGPSQGCFVETFVLFGEGELGSEPIVPAVGTLCMPEAHGAPFDLDWM